MVWSPWLIWSTSFICDRLSLHACHSRWEISDFNHANSFMHLDSQLKHNKTHIRGCDIFEHWPNEVFAWQIQYDGLGFSGWEKKEGVRTVQGVIEEAAKTAFPGFERFSFHVQVRGFPLVLLVHNINVPKLVVVANSSKILNWFHWCSYGTHRSKCIGRYRDRWFPHFILLKAWYLIKHRWMNGYWGALRTVGFEPHGRRSSCVSQCCALGDPSGGEHRRAARCQSPAAMLTPEHCGALLVRRGRRTSERLWHVQALNQQGFFWADRYLHCGIQFGARVMQNETCRLLRTNNQL